MKPHTPFLLLAIPGLLVPWWFLGGYLASGGATLAGLFGALFANDVAGAVAADLLISALIFGYFAISEGRRLGMRWPWSYPLLAFGLGLSVALPLFLAVRDGREVRRGQ